MFHSKLFIYNDKLREHFNFDYNSSYEVGTANKKKQFLNPSFILYLYVAQKSLLMVLHIADYKQYVIKSKPHFVWKERAHSLHCAVGQTLFIFQPHPVCIQTQCNSLNGPFLRDQGLLWVCRCLNTDMGNQYSNENCSNFDSTIYVQPWVRHSQQSNCNFIDFTGLPLQPL